MIGSKYEPEVIKMTDALEIDYPGIKDNMKMKMLITYANLNGYEEGIQAKIRVSSSRKDGVAPSNVLDEALSIDDQAMICRGAL